MPAAAAHQSGHTYAPRPGRHISRPNKPPPKGGIFFFKTANGNPLKHKKPHKKTHKNRNRRTHPIKHTNKTHAGTPTNTHASTPHTARASSRPTHTTKRPSYWPLSTTKGATEGRVGPGPRANLRTFTTQRMQESRKRTTSMPDIHRCSMTTSMMEGGAIRELKWKVT